MVQQLATVITGKGEKMGVIFLVDNATSWLSGACHRYGIDVVSHSVMGMEIE